jgi:pimeloyl-ACP methyl ester carboxylesterase
MKTWAIISLGVAATLAATAAWLYTPDLPRAVLEQKYGVQPTDYVDIDGLHLHVRDTGPRTAPAVILLHGLGSSLQTWDAWTTALAPTHRVVAFDLPGFGLTGTDPAGDYTDAHTVDVVAALMTRLGIAQAALIGNSLGGKIAWNFAVRYPDRVTKLVLVSPDGFASPGFEYNKPAEVPLLLRVLPYVLPKSMLRMNVAAAYANPAKLTDAMFQRYYDMMRAPGVRRALIGRLSQVMLREPIPLLQRIAAPTLLVWGERDAMIPFTNAADYRGAIPHCRLARLAGVGHVPQEEAPDVSVAPVVAFLKE